MTASDAESRPDPSTPAAGPLQGLRVIEFAGIGPAPFCGMLLADMGAEVIVIDRPGGSQAIGAGGMLNRGKRSICLDLKQAADVQTALQLLDSADAVIEGFRPGVMERLGLGPEPVCTGNPKLVYGRMTGWGQTGPLAQAAGHDINYLALTGALSLSARPGQLPTVPATLLGDLGGGAMFLAFGMVCALLEAQRSGQGQVIDAAVLDGVDLLTTLVRSLNAQGRWTEAADQNFFLHSSPFYDVFECSDGLALSLGAIEPQFYAELLQRLGLDDEDPARQHDTKHWPALRARVAARLKTRTRAHWCALLEGSDACVAPVLSLAEAPEHPHQQARGNFQRVEGHWQPQAAPRFSRTPARLPSPSPVPGQDGEAILRELRDRMGPSD